MSKYRAVRTNGYASKKEAARAAELHILLKAGIIFDLKEQVRYELIPADKEAGFPRPICYVADFTFTDVKDGFVVEDVKGFKTPVYNLKKRLMWQVHKIKIREG